jgi:threonine/homoserine/homoserine lactone efflux protein
MKVQFVMSLQFLLIYSLTVFLASIIPGPSMVLALTHGIRYGARRTIATALGNATASFLQAVISMAGLGALLAASETAFSVVKYAGAAYLVWLGLNMMFSKNKQEKKLEHDHNNKSFISLFRQGFCVAAGNPKAIIFFTALFPQFISESGTQLSSWAALLGILVLIAFSCMMIYAFFGSRVKNAFSNSFVGRYMNKIMGTVFISFGIGLASVRE